PSLRSSVARRWGRGWVRRWKCDFRDRARCLRRLKVRVVALEASPACEDAVRELADVSVVGLQRIVIALARDSNPIFGARQLVLQLQKTLVRLQLGIIFLQSENFHFERI